MFLNFKHKSLANVGSLCVGLFFFLFTDGPLPLLHHLDPEGDAAQELVPFVVVAQVGALYPALHRQLLVVVLLGEQQLHSHQGLHVILLQSCKGDGHLSITRPCEDIRGHDLTGGRSTYMGSLAVVGEVHLINAPLNGEILHLDRGLFLQGRACVSGCKSGMECFYAR